MRFQRPTHPQSRGRITTILLKPKILTLILYYVLVFLFIMTVFALIYYEGKFVFDSDGQPQDFFACLYFSVVTQSTLGFGDLSPVSYGRLFVALQTILAGLYTVLFLGVVVAKAVWPPDTIIISEIAVFDYIEQKFRFRFYNSHRLPLCNTRYTVSLRGVGASGNQLLHRNFRAKIQFPGHPIIDTLRPWVVNTESCKGHNLEPVDASKDNILFPEHLTANSILTIQIEGHYPKIGGQSCYGIMRIPAENIKCGRLALVDEIDMAGKTLKRDWNNFSAYVPSDLSACQKCQHYEKCFLSKRIHV